MTSKLYHWVARATRDGDDDDMVEFTSRKLPPRAKVKRLGLSWDVCAKGIPAALAEFTAVEYLAVEGCGVHTLRTAMVPASVRELNIVSDETTKYALDPSLVLPQLTSLIGFTKLTFAAAQVPNLTRLEVKLASPKMVAEIAKLGKLTSLGIGPIADGAVFAQLAHLPLTELSLSRGTATSLGGIEVFANLEILWAQQMTRLADVRAVAALKRLKEAHFGMSKVPPAAWAKIAPTLAKRRVRIDLPENLADEDDE